MKAKNLLITISLTSLLSLFLCSLILAQRRDAPPRPQGQGAPPPGRAGRPGEPPPPDGPPPPRPRGDAAFDFATVEMLGGGLKAVKGLPYSAEAVTETSQVLGNGTRISHKSNMQVARDGEGRLRRERKLDAIGPFTNAGDNRTLIIIDDPVLGYHFVLDEQSRTARKIPNPPPPPPPPGGEQPNEFGDFEEGKVESLGTQTIEGVEAEGMRSTITIPAGRIGNDRALEIVSERWYSKALQVVVMSKHSDPRMGETVYRLTNIKRNEPDASLFKVPSDYTVREGRPPKPPRPPRGEQGPEGVRPADAPPPPPPPGDDRP
ncbi:MAG: hypothetical protein JOZ52_11240 [Acidobacteria bacterium]|nr:hypothetical protein [Acidobacteriota bacterium]